MCVLSNQLWYAVSGLARNCDGNIALTFGLVAPILIALAGLGIDSAAFYNQETHMQSVADSSALAIANEMHLYVKEPNTLQAMGEARVETLLTDSRIAHRPHKTDVRLDMEAGTAEVEISMVAKAFLPVEVWGENPIVVTATATTYGQVKLCVLGLDKKAAGTIKLEGGAIVTAPECAMQSNSTKKDGLISKDSFLTTDATCSAGGYDGSGFTPTPDVDCPVLDDPLALRPRPTVGGCDFLDFTSDDGEQTIMPGHYCGGLKIEKEADVVAEPGVYIISGGKLEVGNDASLRGDYVSFYFADDDATLDFKDKATVELGAPKEGPMAGMLFFENPQTTKERKYEISSGSVRKLLGTIYLPNGIFRGDDKGKGGKAEEIGEASAYTVIVANKIELKNVNLIINADYAASDVPIPAGVGPHSSAVRLIN